MKNRDIRLKEGRIKIIDIKKFVVTFIFLNIFSINFFIHGQKKSGEDYLGQLPLDIKRIIINELQDVNDIGSTLEILSSISLVNKKFNKLLNDEQTISTLEKYLKEKINKSLELSPLLLLSSRISGARNLLFQKNENQKDLINHKELRAQLFRVFFDPYTIKKLNLSEKHILNMIKILFKLKNGFDVNFQAIGNNTFLMWAVCYNFPELVKFLLVQPNINVNLKNSRELTALDIAKIKKSQDIIPLLEQAQKNNEQ